METYCVTQLAQNVRVRHQSMHGGFGPQDSPANQQLLDLLKILWQKQKEVAFGSMETSYVIVIRQIVFLSRM